MNQESRTFYGVLQPLLSLSCNFDIQSFNKPAALLWQKFFQRKLYPKLSFTDLFCEGDTTIINKKLLNCLKGKKQNHSVNISAENLIIDFHLFPVINKSGEVNQISVSMEENYLSDDEYPNPEYSDSEMENDLEYTKQIYENLFHNNPDAIFSFNREGIFTDVNESSAKLAETTREELLNMHFLPLIPKEDHEFVLNCFQKALDGINQEYNTGFISTKGQRKTLQVNNFPIYHQGNIIGVYGIAKDITANYIQERKKGLILNIIKSFGDKPNLKEAMSFTLRLICEELGFDYAETYKVSLNKNNLIRTAFWPAEQDLSDKEEFCTYEIGEGLPGMVWEAKELIIPENDEKEGLLKNMLIDGKKPLQTAVGIPVILKNKLISIICLGSVKETKEIDKQYLNEIAIQIASIIESKKSQDQFNDFFHYSLNLIAVLGLDGFIKMVNPSFEYKFGYNKRELLNIPFIEFIHPEDTGKVIQAMENTAVPDSNFEIRCRKSNGSYLWISWRFSRLMEDENVVYIFGTDITPLKDAYDELSNEIEERKKIQNKLQLSEEKYKSLFNVSPLPMWVLDREHLRFLSVNQAAIDLYGYTREEFLQMTVKDLWAPNQEKRLKKIVNNNPDDFFRLRVRHVTKTGKLLYVSVKSNPLIFDGKKARVSLVNNITAMVKAEEQLGNSEKRFKALVQEGSDLISIVDCDCNYIYSSPASQWMFGLEPAKIKGTNFRDYIHKDDIPGINEKMALLKTQKRVQLPSYRIKNTQNEWRWIETIITNLKAEEAVKGIVMNSRDITEFVEQESKLVESLKRYDIVAKATSDIITDYDIEKDEVTVNEAASDMLGYSPDEIGKKGSWWDDKIHPDDFEEVKALATKMRREKIRNLTLEYRFRCANGNYKYILDRSHLITNENDIPKRIIGSMQDITQRKQHLIAIENHNKRLKEIAWTQSHVVRAPLAKVMGLIDLLLNYKNDLENVDELLINILNSATELDEIIRQIAVQTEEEF